jgi:hypothetical protein
MRYDGAVRPDSDSSLSGSVGFSDRGGFPTVSIVSIASGNDAPPSSDRLRSSKFPESLASGGRHWA